MGAALASAYDLLHRCLFQNIKKLIFFLRRRYISSQAWWRTPIIPTVRKQRQEVHELKASLSYIANFVLKKFS
jgi:hypothetical protein